MSYANSTVGFRRRSRRSRARKRRAVAIVLLLSVVIALLLVVHARSSSGTHSSDVLSSERSAQFSAQQALKNTSCVGGKLRGPLDERTCATATRVAASWSNDDRNQLGKELQGAFAPVLAGASAWSLAVIGADGKTIYDDRAEQAVTPASTQKLVVAATALDALGAQYRYHTLFAAHDGIASDGTIDGDLWLIGSGDPSLGSDDLRNGVAMLAHAGARRIQGRVVVDPSTLTGPELNPHWSADDAGQDYAPPTSAISLDGDRIESTEEVGGVAERVFTPMQDVPRYVADRLNGILVAEKVPPGMPPAVGAAPLESVVLWDHRSAPLQALESHMLYYSDNHYAEQLLRTVGEETAQTPNDKGGIDAERQFLERRGIPMPGLKLYDGSGLSPDDRIAGITLARLLADQESSLYLLLPLGGRQGTVDDYDFTTALGRVRAKTGHLTGVSALAGYVTTQRHGRVAFAFLIDGSPGDPDAAIVRAVDRVATF